MRFWSIRFVQKYTLTCRNVTCVLNRKRNTIRLSCHVQQINIIGREHNEIECNARGWPTLCSSLWIYENSLQNAINSFHDSCIAISKKWPSFSIICYKIHVGMYTVMFLYWNVCTCIYIKCNGALGFFNSKFLFYS